MQKERAVLIEFDKTELSVRISSARNGANKPARRYKPTLASSNRFIDLLERISNSANAIFLDNGGGTLVLVNGGLNERPIS